MVKEDKLSNIERREVKKEIAKAIVSKADSFKSEFKKQTVTAIMAAFGLLIAFAWKDVITAFVDQLNIAKSYGALGSAVFITLISVFGILILSKWAKSGEQK